MENVINDVFIPILNPGSKETITNGEQYVHTQCTNHLLPAGIILPVEIGYSAFGGV